MLFAAFPNWASNPTQINLKQKGTDTVSRSKAPRLHMTTRPLTDGEQDFDISGTVILIDNEIDN